MFKNLTDFKYKRNWVEAIGFYITFLITGLILGAIGGSIAGVFADAHTYQEGYNAGLKGGIITGILYCIALSFVIIIQKKLYKKFLYVILALLSGVVAIFTGSLIALIIPTILTTRKENLL